MISIISKYVIQEIGKFSAIVLTASAGIYVAVDFFEKIDNFMKAELPISRAFIYLACNIPFVISRILPVSVLMAVLIVFGLMSRNNEIIALKSSGISIGYLIKPVLAIGMAFTVLLFLFSEAIVPITSQKANRIWLREVRKESAVVSKEKNIWLKDRQLIMHIRFYNPSEKAIYGITCNHFDDQFRLIRRTDAKKGVYRNGIWTFYDVMDQEWDPTTQQHSVSVHDTRTEPISLHPENLGQVVKKSEEMSLAELYEYVKTVEMEGYHPAVYRVDLYAKVAFPFICVIMSFIGAAIGARPKMKEGMPVSIAYGLGIAFLYWICYSFCVSLGYGEMLPPLIATWTANFIFLCAGALLLLHTE